MKTQIKLLADITSHAEARKGYIGKFIHIPTRLVMCKDWGFRTIEIDREGKLSFFFRNAYRCEQSYYGLSCSHKAGIYVIDETAHKELIKAARRKGQPEIGLATPDQMPEALLCILTNLGLRKDRQADLPRYLALFSCECGNEGKANFSGVANPANGDVWVCRKCQCRILLPKKPDHE